MTSVIPEAAIRLPDPNEQCPNAIPAAMSATAPEPELLLYEIVDGRVCRLEWRGPELLLVVDGREFPVAPQRVLGLLEKYALESKGEAIA